MPFFSEGLGIFGGWVLHWAFGTLWIGGAVLFLVWALRTLKADALKKWAIWLFCIGVIGSFLTAPLAVTGMQIMLDSLGR